MNLELKSTAETKVSILNYKGRKSEALLRREETAFGVKWFTIERNCIPFQREINNTSALFNYLERVYKRKYQSGPSMQETEERKVKDCQNKIEAGYILD